MTKDWKTEEPRYESFDIIIKAREDGGSWFDVFVDMVTENCEGDLETGDGCTCGLESAGGTTGTLDQCYRYQGIAEDIVDRVNKADLLLVLDYLELTQYHNDDAVYEAAGRLRKDCIWDVPAFSDDDYEVDEFGESIVDEVDWDAIINEAWEEAGDGWQSNYDPDEDNNWSAEGWL